MMGSFETMAGIEWQGGYEPRDKIDIISHRCEIEPHCTKITSVVQFSLNISTKWCSIKKIFRKTFFPYSMIFFWIGDLWKPSFYFFHWTPFGAHVQWKLNLTSQPCIMEFNFTSMGYNNYFFIEHHLLSMFNENWTSLVIHV